MDIRGFSQTYTTRGSSEAFSTVGDLLTVRLGNYGSAVEMIEMVAYRSQSHRDTRSGFRELFDKFEKYVARLPKIAFRRWSRRVEFHFVSTLVPVFDDLRQPTAQMCNIAAKEVVSLLALLAKRIKSTDDFDLDGFLADSARLLTEGLATREEWVSVRAQAIKMRQAVRLTKNAWEALDVNWRLYHRGGRAILDDPLFWDPANGFAPHGNDTGADLLADYRRWEKHRRGASPLQFLERLMADWGITPIDWTLTDEPSVRSLQCNDSIRLRVTNDAAVALAFAILKIRGECPPAVAKIALAALARESFCVGNSGMAEEMKESWKLAIDKMRYKLESLLELET